MTQNNHEEIQKHLQRHKINAKPPPPRSAKHDQRQAHKMTTNYMAACGSYSCKMESGDFYREPLCYNPSTVSVDAEQSTSCTNTESC